ncbi:unnamed protein product [Didymodactylos carnosus]|uniref:Metallo-beta-lactamase domain-containing protein n=1 Tax=Didymodactylos carnosus TaxID=1234261 RepID=A0A815MDA9_9BILA|nr:unnamed protein product [Didymodactylos carnosus]CAF1420979.1 unnamed protein product [Didymodactylos carnosus]CAF4071212.1 unnamed protein product [Didymodactylos carnosus]CAF4304214.1 unnamed protein product [Didymodactylos carnosus]
MRRRLSIVWSKTAYLFASAAVGGIPGNSKGPTIPAKGYLVQHIDGGLYWLVANVYQVMFLVSNEGVIVVDAPPYNIGDYYLKAISEVTNKVVTHVVYSHDHLDHIGSSGIFPKNATYIAHKLVADSLSAAKAMATNVSLVPPIPTRTFTKNLLLTVGNQTLQLAYHGDGHSPGNIFIYAPKQKVLMLVDVIFPGWLPFVQLAYASDVLGFIKDHDIVLKYDFKTFIGGHTTRLGTRKDVLVQKQYISDLTSAARQALDKIPFTLPISLRPWKQYTDYLNAVTETCTKIMLRKNWAKKLHGIIFLNGHCDKMIQNIRIVPRLALT